MLYSAVSVLVNFRFFQANELSGLGVDSDFCLGLVGGLCDTSKSICSFVSSKLIMFDDLCILDVATSIPLSLDLSQC